MKLSGLAGGFYSYVERSALIGLVHELRHFTVWVCPLTAAPPGGYSQIQKAVFLNGQSISAQWLCKYNKETSAWATVRLYLNSDTIFIIFVLYVTTIDLEIKHHYVLKV